MSAIIAGLIRHLLTMGGGALMASGYVTAEQAAKVSDAVVGFQGNTPEIIGAAAAIIGVGASVWSKHKNKAKK